MRGQLALLAGAGEAAATPIVWIRAHQARLVALPAALRQAHVAYLRGLANEPAHARLPPAATAPEAVSPHRVQGQLCGWCGGQCCRHGAASDAFLQIGHLRRWQLDHPGSTLADAAEAYVSRLPQQHVKASCLYHGAHGCTLDRSMRSDPCNRFACDGLRELRVATADDGPGRWLFVMHSQQGVDAAALADGSGLLELQPKPGAAA